MCRALKCGEYEYGDVIVVQGDAAESFCIVYQGEVSVHCWRERSEVKLMLKERPCGSMYISVTLDTFQLLSGWLKDLAFNILHIGHVPLVERLVKGACVSNRTTARTRSTSCSRATSTSSFVMRRSRSRSGSGTCWRLA